MNLTLLIVIILAVIVSGALLFIAFGSGKSTKSAKNIATLVKNQRSAEGDVHENQKPKPSVVGLHKNKGELKQEHYYGEGEDLERRLRCAGMSMMPITFRALQLAGGLIGGIFLVTVGFGVKILWLPFGVATGMLMVNSVVSYKVTKRFKNFDNDYPNFLLSLCGLLKTGMNPMQAIEAAIEPLDDTSLLRLEVKLMIERLRFGVAEEASIGSFGETIDHPEIELFVQAIMLSRRLGGTLSDTLERLAKQVRKRQFFRGSANAAVSLQRGSVWTILGILVALLGYIMFTYPALVIDGFKLPLGQIIWQFGIMLIMTGIWWARQITKLRI